MDDKAYGERKSGNFKKRSRKQVDNGKWKRQNPYPSHDQSASTSKPVETLYRILCPMKKIGSVLGKGGDIVNTLREETCAKIRVADAIPGAEERVIIIFNHPSKSWERSDDADMDPKDKFEDMRPHCPAQDALMKVYDRIVADDYVRNGVVIEKSNGDDAVIARLLVPNNQVGCLIGKGGAVIQMLRTNHSGASIRVLPAENLPPCAMRTDELVQLSGAPAVVKKTLYDISTRLHQHPRKENPSIDDLIYAGTQGLVQPGPLMPPPPHGNPMSSHHQSDAYLTPPPWLGGYRNDSSSYSPSNYESTLTGKDEETPDEFAIRILCPTRRIGGVIGKSGANVRQLEHQTQAKIQVEETNPEAEERVINVSSKELPWDPVSRTIKALLQLQSQTCITSEDGTITTRLLVPSSKVGCLLGEGGNVINEMRNRTRADIRVHSKKDKPNYISSNEEIVQISGNPEVVKEVLLEIASRIRTRTFRSANAALNLKPVFPRVFAPPSDRILGRGFAPPSMTGPAGCPPPVYPTRGIHAPPEDISNQSPLPSSVIRGPPPPSMYRGPPSSSMIKSDDTLGYKYPKAPPRPAYESQGYPAAALPTAARHPSMSTTMEIKIPNSSVTSVLGVGGRNISEIRKISGARVIIRDSFPGSPESIVEIQGSSEQSRAAQTLIQAFVVYGGDTAPHTMYNY